MKKVMGICGQKAMELCEDGLCNVLKHFADEIANGIANAGQEMIREKFADKKPLKYWAKIIGDAADKIKKRLVDEYGYKYIGGRLTFTLSESSSDAVSTVMQLYFLDNMGKCRLAEAEKDMPSFLIKSNSMDELIREQKIIYDIK